MLLLSPLFLGPFALSNHQAPISADSFSTTTNSTTSSLFLRASANHLRKPIARDCSLHAYIKHPPISARSFWLLLLVMFVCGSGDFLVTTHLIPCATDYGISATTAGNMLAWSGLLSLAGILIAGPASDLVGNKIPVALTFALRFLLFLLILKYQNILSFYVFSLMFGFTFLITAPITTTLIGRLYGLSHVGLISGFITTIHHLGGGFWAYMGGLFFDKTGSYQLAFIISAVMALGAVCSALFITENSYQTGYGQLQE